MNESLLRWEGRIGSLKGLAIVVLIFLLIFLFPTVENLTIAWKNPSDSKPVTVSQFIDGTVGLQQYVQVSGLASYELAYIETEDGSTKSIVYPLIDQGTNTIVFVRTTNISLQSAADANVVVIGVTTKPETDLRTAVEKDIAEINAAGYQTNATLYIEEGKRPGQLIMYLIALAAIGFAGVLSIFTFFFRTTVFGPYPVQQIPPGAAISKAIQATGTFQQVKKMEPLEFGRSKRKFENSIANLFMMDGNTLGVYIHFIYTHRVYGIQVSKQETDWMILIKPSQVIALEPGKIYGWRDSWAVSVRFRDQKEKEQTLFIRFADAPSQASFVHFLREKGFAVSSGQYPVTGNVWAQ